MLELGDILKWLRFRRIAKNRKMTENALLQLNALTVTIHGRQMLSAACKDGENGLPNEIRRMYWTLLREAPVREWAQWN